ncbi:TB2/DP1, HVA22 family-domain-containing protein [Melanogaster broomeanus]|nr:TB2/DP1, HVA22 family-domain-containing protein [Melanogaster broomeanus]
MSTAQKVQQHPVFIQAQNKANYYLSQLDKELTKYPVLNTFEQRTQVPKAYVAITTVSGWALPAYLSFKALETPGQQDDIQWLTYWVVFGFLNFTESIALGMVLYYTVFILWLQLPVFRGAQVTYLSIIKPVLLNVSGSSRAVAPTDTVTADGLRDRVNTATAD